MTKEQIIFMDTMNVNPMNGSLIKADTGTLDVIIDDATWSTNCCLIGDRMEWKPLVWMMHEKNRIRKLERLRVVLCEAKLADHVKQEIRTMFDGLEVEFYELLLPGIYHVYQWGQDMTKQYKDVERVNTMYYSVGTMRLNRFFLVHWLQQNKASNFGHPVLNKKEMEVLKHPLSRLCTKDFSNYENVSRRFFGECHVDTYWEKQVDLMLRAKISIVTEQPLFDHVERFYSEKLTHSMACKTLPFMISNKNDNDNLKDLGFRPYVGFDYSAESIADFVERWQTLLDSNRHFLLEDKHASAILEKNKDIIEHNYSVLSDTDWRQKALEEISNLPTLVRDFLENKFFKK